MLFTSHVLDKHTTTLTAMISAAAIPVMTVIRHRAEVARMAFTTVKGDSDGTANRYNR
jgi:hypothetical protein